MLPINPMKFLPVFLMTALCTGSGACSSKKQPAAPTYAEPPRIFDKDLQPFLDRYVMEAEARGVPVDKVAMKELRQLVWSSEIPQGFSKTSINLGRCTKLNNTNADPRLRYRIIQITKPNALKMAGPIMLDDVTLRSVVYHELGHCLHNFEGHRPAGDDAIMSTGLPATRATRMDELVEEHFMLMSKKSTENLKPF